MKAPIKISRISKDYIRIHSILSKRSDPELYEKKKIIYELRLNKNKTVIKGETTLALLKNIFDKRSGKKFD